METTLPHHRQRQMRGKFERETLWKAISLVCCGCGVCQKFARSISRQNTMKRNQRKRRKHAVAEKNPVEVVRAKRRRNESEERSVETM